MKKYLLFSLIFIIIVFFVVSTAEAACSITGTASIRYGTRSSRVFELQKCLITQGYLAGKADGSYGPKTLNAIRNFYKNALNVIWDGKSIGPKGISVLKGSGSDLNIGDMSTGYRYAKNEKDLKQYLTTPNQYGRIYTTSGLGVAIPMGQGAEKMDTNASNPSRVSETNVQVAGIDEADIIKTDGKNLFMAKPSYWYYSMPFIRGGAGVAMDSKMIGIMPPAPAETPKTQVIGVYPVSSMALLSESVDLSGDMLYDKNSKTLVVMNGQKIAGYDVADPKNPKQSWKIDLKDNTSLTTSRMKDGNIYLVTSTWLNTGKPCPVPLYDRAGVSVSVVCPQILVPEVIGSISNMYTIMKISAKDGVVLKTTSVAEQGYNNAIAMFENNLYLASNWDGGYNGAYLKLYSGVVRKFVSSLAIEKIDKILGYDISLPGKLNEIEQVVSGDLASLSDSDRLKKMNDIQNLVDTEVKAHVRDLYQSKITRIALDTLSVAATGAVPGQLVNQFALDEYAGNLRVATTMGETWRGNSTNDVYVLGLDLKENGSIKDMGLTERIYSVRFMGDVGYLVTFRQTDPFYVLSLKNPTNPTISGELKIPGYSSYLEDLGSGLVLGVGREGSNTKLSLFDVTNPKNPVEKSKYVLANNWSEAENNHHAFLRDDLHKVFFIPASDGGYVFSYAGGTISLKATVAGTNVKRAIYINDAMYVIANEKITVLDENTWQVLKEWEIN